MEPPTRQDVTTPAFATTSPPVMSAPADFARLYDEHAPAVYATAHGVLRDAARTEDVVHDVFLSLWHRPERFDASRGQVGVYLRLLARSRALDAWRRGQVAGRARDRLAALDARATGRVEDSPAEAAERSDDGARIRAAIARLPEPQREVIVLAYWGDLTVEQVAQRVEIPLGTAKSRVRLGLARLRDELESGGALAAHAGAL